MYPVFILSGQHFQCVLQKAGSQFSLIYFTDIQIYFIDPSNLCIRTTFKTSQQVIISRNERGSHKGRHRTVKLFFTLFDGRRQVWYLFVLAIYSLNGHSECIFMAFRENKLTIPIL